MSEPHHVAPPEHIHGRMRRMTGRDPHEPSRVGTPLELLFDLVFVVAIGQAASQMGHMVSEGHYWAGIGGFAVAMYGVLWAWVNFAWFASAFDTDDWIYRLCTMGQMVGVTILALGVAPMFRSLDLHQNVDNQVMVSGYVVMRVAMVFQWLRAARQSPTHRAACLAYARTIVLAQIGWVAVAWVDMPLPPTLALVLVLLLVELVGPYLAETRHGGTPWHPHHIAERYAALAIIVLGEGVVGTVASLSAVVQAQGWSMDAALIAVAGMGLTFGMWWSYFVLPAGDVLHARRERSFAWGYGNLILFAAIAGMGAGLDVAALFIEHKAHIGAATVVSALAIPVTVYMAGVYRMYSHLLDERYPLPAWAMGTTFVLLFTAPLLAASGVSMAMCLLVVMLAPAISVLGYEAWGRRQLAQALQRALHS